MLGARHALLPANTNTPDVLHTHTPSPQALEIRHPTRYHHPNTSHRIHTPSSPQALEIRRAAPHRYPHPVHRCSRGPDPLARLPPRPCCRSNLRHQELLDLLRIRVRLGVDVGDDRDARRRYADATEHLRPRRVGGASERASRGNALGALVRVCGSGA